MNLDVTRAGAGKDGGWEEDSAERSSGSHTHAKARAPRA